MTMNVTDFVAIAYKELDSISAFVEMYEYSFEDLIITDDIVHIMTFSGEFVINAHMASQEIWLSSPISGPDHFRPVLFEDEKIKWVSRSTGRELSAVLLDEMELIKQG